MDLNWCVLSNSARWGSFWDGSASHDPWISMVFVVTVQNKKTRMVSTSFGKHTSFHTGHPTTSHLAPLYPQGRPGLPGLKGIAVGDLLLEKVGHVIQHILRYQRNLRNFLGDLLGLDAFPYATPGWRYLEMTIVHTHVFDHPDRYVLSIYRDMIFVYVHICHIISYLFVTYDQTLLRCFSRPGSNSVLAVFDVLVIWTV